MKVKFKFEHYPKHIKKEYVFRRIINLKLIPESREDENTIDFIKTFIDNDTFACDINDIRKEYTDDGIQWNLLLNMARKLKGDKK